MGVVHPSVAISIHAPRGGSDVILGVVNDPTTISIHAPRGGSDVAEEGDSPFHCDFNPRSPWGERRLVLLPELLAHTFQSTLPVGGATRPLSG